MNFTEFSKTEKELAERITKLQGRINRLEFIFEANRDANNKIVAAIQSGQKDVARMALEATEKAVDAFKQ